MTRNQRKKSDLQIGDEKVTAAESPGNCIFLVLFGKRFYLEIISFSKDGENLSKGHKKMDGGVFEGCFRKISWFLDFIGISKKKRVRFQDEPPTPRSPTIPTGLPGELKDSQGRGWPAGFLINQLVCCFFTRKRLRDDLVFLKNMYFAYCVIMAMSQKSEVSSTPKKQKTAREFWATKTGDPQEIQNVCWKEEISPWALSTRSAPTSCKWSYNPSKWPYKWVTGVISPYL